MTHITNSYKTLDKIIFYCTQCSWEVHLNEDDTTTKISPGDGSLHTSGGLSISHNINPVPEPFESFLSTLD